MNKRTLQKKIIEYYKSKLTFDTINKRMDELENIISSNLISVENDIVVEYYSKKEYLRMCQVDGFERKMKKLIEKEENLIQKADILKIKKEKERIKKLEKSIDLLNRANPREEKTNTTKKTNISTPLFESNKKGPRISYAPDVINKNSFNIESRVSDGNYTIKWEDVSFLNKSIKVIIYGETFFIHEMKSSPILQFLKSHFIENFRNGLEVRIKNSSLKLITDLKIEHFLISKELAHQEVIDSIEVGLNENLKKGKPNQYLAKSYKEKDHEYGDFLLKNYNSSRKIYTIIETVYSEINQTPIEIPGILFSWVGRNYEWIIFESLKKGSSTYIFKFNPILLEYEEHVGRIIYYFSRKATRKRTLLKALPDYQRVLGYYKSVNHISFLSWRLYLEILKKY